MDKFQRNVKIIKNNTLNNLIHIKNYLLFVFSYMQFVTLQGYS